jgi:hypothetical protein
MMPSRYAVGPPDFDLTADALVERYRSHTFIYGRWDRLFGCWQITDRRAGPSAFMPRWPLLDRTGALSFHNKPVEVGEEWDEMFLQQKSYFHDAEWEAHWSYDVPIDETATPAIDMAAEDAFQRYIDLIPTRIRRLIGPFGNWQWVVLSMVWDTPAFEAFLGNEPTRSGPGFVASCLALSNADVLTRSDRRALCRQIMFDKRADIIRRFASDCRASAAAVKCLSKLEATTLDRASCVEWLDLLHDPDKEKVLHHHPALTPSNLRLLSRLPSWACSILLLRRLVKSPGHVRELALDLLRDLGALVESHPPETKRSIRSSLKRSEDGAHLVDILLGWRHRIGERAPFPPAPISEIGHLSPLTSANMMKREALRMHNCVVDYIPSVLMGTHYFYHWSGAESATISLERNSKSRWQLAKSVGIANHELSSSTSNQIGRVIGVALEDCARCAIPQSDVHDSGLAIQVVQKRRVVTKTASPFWDPTSLEGAV